MDQLDQLDQLLAAADPLLNRVDEVLSAVGAPGGHDVWRELRRVRLLPGDAARAVAALHPKILREAGSELRADARVHADLADTLPLAVAWSGEAAEAYEAARRSAAERLNGGPDSLSARMEATAELAEALTGWMLRTRGELAAALAEVMLSIEAITLLGGDGPPADQAAASAAIGARLLRTIADSYDAAEDLLAGSVDLQTAI
jgi:hypothetical protein